MTHVALPAGVETQPVRRIRALTPAHQIGLMSAMLLTAAIVLLSTTPYFESSMRPGTDWLPLPVVLAVAFGVAVVAVFHVEFKREAISFSVSEVPLVFALVFLAPTSGIAARVIGGAIGLAIFKRPPLFKLIFNVSMFALETALAYQVVRAIAGPGSDDVTLVVASSIAAVATGISSSIVVAIAISRFEGGTLHRVLAELRASWIFAVNAALATSVLSSAMVTPALAIVATIPVAVLWWLMLRYGRIGQRLRDLNEVHGFVGRVGRSLDLAEISESAVTEAARLLRSDTAILVLADAEGSFRMTSTGSLVALFPADPADPYWIALMGSEETRLVDENELLETEHLVARSLPELIAAPLDDETGLLGVLVIAGRSGAAMRFDANDVARVSSLAQQLSSSLRKGMLHRQIEHEARHDSLTGLPNRSAFELHVAETIRESTSTAGLYVLMLDLDRFKEVNDTLGHHAGDELLAEFARRMAAQLCPEDMLARLAGDEFAILVHRETSSDVQELAEACANEAGRAVTLDGLSVVVTASIGIAGIAPNDVGADAPMRRADIAMYNAKSHHLGIETYRNEIDRRTPERLSMLGDLREAIELGSLGVAYQPKLDLMTGMVTGAEALVRWTHAQRGVVSPAEFVRVAEDTGLIKQLTDLMLARGIQYLHDLGSRGYDFGLAVNLSTHDLLDSRLPDRVQAHLSTNGVDPGALTLEITESSLLVEAPRTRATINELHEIGVRMSIDDFGTGYSSLSYLRRLPVRELKVDRSFVANLLTDEQDEVIVRSTIDLGHNLGLEVVAEGVESEEILDRLRWFGCDVAQGYWIARPLAADDFFAWLESTDYPSRRPNATTLPGPRDVEESR